MFGIVAGMLRTLQHFVHPQPVTRKYPYEKRDLPERSRGLIALLLEPETSIFKCESCLMCEKACPPRAISISYTFKNGFRKRPPLAPEGQGTAIPRGGRKFTGNLGVAGVWPKASPPPAHDRLHEDEVHHVLEPAFAR